MSNYDHEGPGLIDLALIITVFGYAFYGWFLFFKFLWELL